MKNEFNILVFVLGLLFITGCSKDGNSSTSDSPKQLSHAEQLVKENCKVCHAQGIRGAPIIGNKKMWSNRLPKGEETLVANAINGFGLMPAKGGKTQLSDEEIAIAVKYMMSQVQ